MEHAKHWLKVINDFIIVAILSFQFVCAAGISDTIFRKKKPA